VNGGILPLMLLGATLGLLLSKTSLGKVAWRGWVAAAIAALAASLLPLPTHLVIPIEVGLWISTVITAATVYLPRGTASRLILPLAVNAGGWLGAVAAVTSMRPLLLAALLLALLFIPIGALASRGSAIAVKVVASWMIAIGTLAVFVSMVPTPGYKQDHMQ
jgi:hypothetical protein